MARFQETRWFSLSGRELRVLIAAVALALAAVGVTRIVAHVWGQGEITVRGTGDTLVPPLRLNVNAAPPYELEMLPGVGPKTARAIARHREQHGPFQELGELTRVKGIGPKTVDDIRPHAMCAPPESPPTE